MHHWGDAGVDWQGIGSAAEFIGTRLQRWGGIHVSQYKEKWGTVRVYCTLGLLWMHDLQPAFLIGPLDTLVYKYQVWIYTLVYGQALKRWPHLRREILHGADHTEPLRKYGVHTVRTGAHSYEIHYDWHPDAGVIMIEEETQVPGENTEE